MAVDHSEDNTTALLREWLVRVQGLYHRVEWRPMEEPRSDGGGERWGGSVGWEGAHGVGRGCGCPTSGCWRWWVGVGGCGWGPSLFFGGGRGVG